MNDVRRDVCSLVFAFIRSFVRSLFFFLIYFPYFLLFFFLFFLSFFLFFFFSFFVFSFFIFPLSSLLSFFFVGFFIHVFENTSSDSVELDPGFVIIVSNSNIIKPFYFCYSPFLFFFSILFQSTSSIHQASYFSCLYLIHPKSFYPSFIHFCILSLPIIFHPVFSSIHTSTNPSIHTSIHPSILCPHRGLYEALY